MNRSTRLTTSRSTGLATRRPTGPTMKRILLVARHEFLTNVKRRSFLFTAFGMPLLIIALQFAIGYFVEQRSNKTGTLGQIGYVDLTADGLLRLAVDRPGEFRAHPDEQAARAALVAGEIGAYFVVPADYVEQGVIHAYGIKDIPRSIENQMTGFLTDNLLADWPPERAKRLQNPMRLTITTLEGGQEIGEDSSIGVILVPFIFALLFMMAIFTTSGFLMQGVVEEKENRLAEILMTSITPLQMLWGKISGLGALGLLQVVVWAAAGGLLLSQGSSLWSGLEGVSVPTSLLIWGPLYLLFGYLLFSGLMAGVGAAVTAMPEAQQLAGIFSFAAVTPMIASIAFLNNANGPLPTALSLVPFTAPVAMVMRLPFADVPLWQLLLSVLLMALTTLLVVWLAAQVFRIGLLMYDTRLGLRTLWAALRQGLDIVPEMSRAEEEVTR
jgi:ABC-2 type transport system permease protein